MILSRLDLKAFGRFSNASLDLSAGPRRFHLVYGPNESGKSTTLRAITSLLFGMPHVADDNYLHTNAQMRVGGLLVDPDSGASLACVRRRGRKATLRDGDDGQPINELELEEMLGGITRETFLTRFGLSHDELVSGGAAILSGEGDLGAILFAAGAGVGRLREIQDELDEAGNRLFTPRGHRNVINAGIRQLDEQRKALREAQVPPAEFAQLTEEMKQRKQLVNELNAQMHENILGLARLRSYQQAMPLLPRWRAAVDAFKKVENVPDLDSDFTERRRQAISDQESARSRRIELETRLAELTARLEMHPVDVRVLNQETEIQSLFQEVASRNKADRDRIGLIRTLKKMDRKITDLLQQLSVEITASDDESQAIEIDESVERLKVSDSLRVRIRELASDHGRLIGQRNDASDAVETVKRRLLDVTQELESFQSVGDPTPLIHAMEAVGNPQLMLDTLSEQQESCETLGRQCNELVRRLHGFSGTVEQAVRLEPPTEVAIQRLIELMRNRLQEVLRAKEDLETLQEKRADADRQLRTLQQQMPLPTNEELDSSRAMRDLSIDALIDQARLGEISSDLVEQVRLGIRETDRLVDTIRNHSEKVHQREAMRVLNENLVNDLTKAKAIVAELENDFDSAEKEWWTAWQACGVEPGQPEQMQRWLVIREQLCDAFARFGEEEQRVEQTRARITRVAKRLKNVLVMTNETRAVGVSETTQSGLFDEPAEVDLISLYDEAVEARGNRLRMHQRNEALLQRQEELAEELPQSEKKFENAQKAVEDWREDWRRTTEAFVESDRVGTVEVLQMLDQISDLTSKKRERDILATRIGSIGEDELVYSERVHRLATAVGQSLESEQSATSIAQAIYQRLQSERELSRSRDGIREQIESLKLRLSEVSVQQSACRQVLKRLCEEAGCDSAERLPEIESVSRERRELQASRRDLENQLSILAGDQTLDELIEATAEQSLALLDVEIEQQEISLAKLRDKISSIQQEIGASQHKLNLMDGSGHASELLQSIQMTVGRLSRDTEEYARKKVASLLLRQAIEHYRKENQSPVLENANRFFEQLTCGEYSVLKPDFDTKGKAIIFGVNAKGIDVPVASMSTGTADALYLAMRLASLEHQLSHGKAIPLIIDDCLVQLDDRRSIAALRAFSKLSEKTQVILFTHHEHLQSLAEKHLKTNEFHLHELSV